MIANRYARIALVVGLAAIVFAVGCGDDKKSTNSTADQSITFNLDYYVALDLETGDTASAGIGDPTPPAEMDFNFAYNGARPVHSVLFQRSGRQVAHLPNRTFASVTVADTLGAPFTSALIDTSFDANRVILVRTDAGNIYKLGNPVETASSADGCTFDYVNLTD